LIDALLLAALLVSGAPQPPQPVDYQRQILVIYSTRRDAQIALVGEQALPRALESGLGGRFDYYSEFIDPARFEDPDYQKALGEFLQLKYQNRRFDAMIAVGNDATRFVARHRETFSGLPPVVYYTDSETVPRPANATGVVAALDLAGTVRVARALDPRLAHVYLVSGADRNDTAFDRTAHEQLRAFEPGIEIVSLAGLQTAALEARLQRLPPHSAVYYLVVDQDGAGQYFHPLAYLERVAAAANAPTYSWVDSAIGHGAVGGSLKSQEAQIDAVAALTLRVLHGTPAESIPPVIRNLNMLEVDWRQLQRWRLSESRLPPGTAVVYRDPSAWERYRSYIVAALIVVLAQTALIAGLLVQRSRRWRAEGRLLKREGQLRASYARIRDLGARLLHAQDRERSHIARELHDDVGQQLALIEMDVKLLGGASEAAAGLLDRVQSAARSVRELSHRLHPAKLRLIGLVAALKGLQAELANGGVDMAFAHDSVPAMLPPDVTVCLFRVAQEALQNAIKYSRCRHISLALKGSGGCLALVAEDDGEGFDVDAAWGSGLGLVSMHERVEAIGGEIRIHSAKGTGTRVEVTVPIAAARAGTVAV
jgi:signal transduction histidine kinase